MRAGRDDRPEWDVQGVDQDVIDTSLDEEITDPLSYGKHDLTDRGTGTAASIRSSSRSGSGA